METARANNGGVYAPNDYFYISKKRFKPMKKLLICVTLCLSFLCVDAQTDSKWPPLDSSPMDAATYPRAAAWRNYMGDELRDVQPKAKVLYSRPQKKGRTIFGELVPYGKEWRLGANESTTITFYQDVDIDGTTLSRGTYSVFVTPTENTWTFVFSTQTGIWGGENRDKTSDVVSVTVPTEQVSQDREALTMTFQMVDDYHFNYVVQWGTVRATLEIGENPILFSPLDKSPMDKVVYPDKATYTNYMKGDDAKLTPKISVLYSRPYKNDRKIFGNLLKVGDTWRIGANESTEITLYEDVTIKGTDIKMGEYVLYAELKEGSWDIIFSTDLPAWGPANRDESKDAYRVNIPLSSEKEDLENLSIIFDEKSPKLVHMIIGWETTRAELPIEFK